MRERNVAVVRVWLGTVGGRHYRALTAEAVVLEVSGGPEVEDDQDLLRQATHMQALPFNERWTVRKIARLKRQAMKGLRAWLQSLTGVKWRVVAEETPEHAEWEAAEAVSMRACQHTERRQATDEEMERKLRALIEEVGQLN